ncbi:MAG: sacsin N-terminal ATP-binding-like domain-containing protein [Anaerolineae bacterium]
MTPREHIESIRKDKFGLGPDGRPVQRNPLLPTLQRAVSKLASDLYSKETHFVFELIQNAEDNSYAPHVSPELHFFYLPEDPTSSSGSEGALLVVNNEVGFRLKDAESLCDVGLTTKGDRTKGYIGEKGIGFKSVFQVSATPHVFSRGYQFRFQETDDAVGLGYIVPYWIEEVPEQVCRHQDCTCILLPLKARRAKAIQLYLHDIRPETLLFLAKLTALTVQLGDGPPLRLHRDASQVPLVRLLVNDSERLYWVVGRSFPKPGDLIRTEHVDVSESVVSVALPLSSDGGQESGGVFAYLPTELKSGLPFTVNADFLLSASRESIQVDRPWNKWLRDCIPDVFLDAFEGLIWNPEHREQAYQFIPLPEKDRDPFFKPVAETIVGELKRRPVVWTVAGEQPVIPSEARLCPKEFRALFVKDPLPAPLREKARPVLPALEKYREQLRAIGVREVSDDEETLECLRDDEWLRRQPRSWFAHLYRYLSGRTSIGYDDLKGLPIIPVQEGTLASPGSASVFLPAQDLLEIQDEAALRLEDLGFGFLHEETWRALREQKEVMRWMDEVLGVKEPTLENQVWGVVAYSQRAYTQESTLQLRARATRFIRDRWSRLSDECKEGVLSGLGVIFEEDCATDWERGDCEVVVPPGLDAETGWQLVFPDWRGRDDIGVISAVYLDPDTEEERRRWAAFWGDLYHGADAPDPECRAIKSYPSRDLSPYQKQRFDCLHWQYLDDYVAPGWLRELTFGGGTKADADILERRCRALLEWLRRQSHLHRGRFRWTQVHRWRGNERKPLTEDSEFLHCLKNAPWFPSTKGLRRPPEVFLDKQEIRDIFGDSVPYTTHEASDKVVDLIGLRKSASNEEMLNLLRDLSTRKANEIDHEVVKRVYGTLQSRNVEGLVEAFREHRLIFVPNAQPCWLAPDQVVWPDLSRVFGDAFVYLRPHYPPDLERFFTRQLKVTTEVSEKEYAQAWLRLAEQENPDPAQVESALGAILQKLIPLVQKEQRPDWWEDSKARVRIWSEGKDGKKFVRPQEAFVADDGEYRDMFARWWVWFAWQPKEIPLAKLLPLYRELGARVLSEEVEVEFAHAATGARFKKAEFLTPAAKGLIARQVWNRNQETYKSLRDAGLLEDLLRTQEYEVNELLMTYRLDWWSETREAKVSWKHGERELFLAGHDDDDKEFIRSALAEELCRHLLRGSEQLDLRDSFHKALGATEGLAKHYIQKDNLRMPDEEEDWLREVLSWEQVAAPEEETEVPEGVPPATEPGRVPPSVPDTGRRDGRPMRHEPPPWPRKRRGRLRSYVEPSQELSKEAAETEREDTKETDQEPIAQAGIAAAVAYEREQGRVPEVRAHSAPGWDIYSYEPGSQEGQKGRLVRRIEIKSLSGSWDDYDVGLTSREFWSAREYADAYYLYVVEWALDPTRQRIHIIKDPLKKAHEFRFDGEWKKVAESGITKGYEDTEVPS